MLKNDPEFNLSKILEGTTNNLKEAFPDVQSYLLELSKEELQVRLTPGQALKIAETLLEKIGFKVSPR